MAANSHVIPGAIKGYATYGRSSCWHYITKNTRRSAEIRQVQYDEHRSICGCSVMTRTDLAIATERNRPAGGGMWFWLPADDDVRPLCGACVGTKSRGMVLRTPVEPEDWQEASQELLALYRRISATIPYLGAGELAPLVGPSGVALTPEPSPEARRD